MSHEYDDPLNSASLAAAAAKALALQRAYPGEPLDKQALAQIALGRKLTLYDRSLDMHVSNLRKKLGAHPDGRPRILALRGRDVEVDASAVERVGAQCLQVLLSARATWDADGAAFAVVQASDEFTSTLALLGAPIDQHFNPRELSA